MFLTVEGGEGAGKSTLIKALAAEMGAIATREPGGCELAEDVRKMVLHQHLSPEAKTLLFLAARAEHVHEVIRPALNAHKTVICDRFHHSTIAYQGYACDLGVDRVTELCKLAVPLWPDKTILLDLDPKIGLERAKKVTPEGDTFESETLAFHEKVRQGFLMQSQDPRLLVIDATQSPDQILKEALAWLS